MILISYYIHRLIMQNQQIEKSNTDPAISSFISNLVADMRSLTSILLPVSK
jgi:hypothetical protein